MYCLTNDTVNIRTKQRALQVFRNKAILSLNASPHLTTETVDEGPPCDTFLRVMIPALFGDGSLSWNPTVNKMTALALQKLQVS